VKVDAKKKEPVEPKKEDKKLTGVQAKNELDDFDFDDGENKAPKKLDDQK